MVVRWGGFATPHYYFIQKLVVYPAISISFPFLNLKAIAPLCLVSSHCHEFHLTVGSFIAPSNPKTKKGPEITYEKVTPEPQNKKTDDIMVYK